MIFGGTPYMVPPPPPTPQPYAEIEVLPPEEEVDIDIVLGWRVQQLVLAGYAYLQAEEIGQHKEIDLHKATDMLDQGCPRDLAVAILL